MRALVIIPAYNEAANIAVVIGAVRQSFAGPVVVVDDGSNDDTGAQARAAGAIVLCHPCNLGIGAAVQTAFQYAVGHDYDAVVRLDGDGQHDPAYIAGLLEQLRSGQADVVIGSRFLGREGFQSTLIRRMGIAILTLVSALVGTRVTDPTSGYWALNRRAFALLAHMQADDYPETEALLQATRAGCRVREIPVIMQPRLIGRSSIAGVARSGFYMAKVLLALAVSWLGRRQIGPTRDRMPRP